MAAKGHIKMSHYNVKAEEVTNLSFTDKLFKKVGTFEHTYSLYALKAIALGKYKS